MPEAARQLLAPLPAGAARETLKDMACNQSLRSDIFTRPGPALPPPAHPDLLNAFLWQLLPGAALPADGLFPTKTGPVGSAPETGRALFSALARRSQRFAGLLALPAFRCRPALLNEFLQLFLAMALAHPVFPGYDPAAAARLNRVLQSGSGKPPALAEAFIASGL
ncbi:hypothetical protein H0485_03865 [Pseudogemmobacter sp. CC-YST710]|uniref:Uncharacterized protein n=2 Tax=Pseudogemmobacter faecipullorum TaxID=2755041 RepID=A0ABS8CIE8_9RHOB|nr:hypothetical protein [Pseudogemmobacter faecipullorum]